MQQIIKISTAFLLLVLFSGNAFSADRLSTKTASDSTSKKIQFQPAQIKLGLMTGWETPFGTGFELSSLFIELIDINAGFGIGTSGAKVGIGTRIYPVRNKKFSPMVGTYFYHAFGINSINVSVQDETGVYKIEPGNAVLVDVGFRFRFAKGHYVFACLGYSIPVSGGEAVYKSGSNSGSVQSFADGLTLGGISVNVGFLFKLTKGSYKKLD
jgi:hypothetical protein